MAWMYLVLAGMCEVIGVTFMKAYNDTKKKKMLGGLYVTFACSFTLLSLAMKDIPMGTAYAVWTGLGTAGSALLGIVIYKESKDWKRLMFLSFILIGAIGLKLVS